MTKVADSRKDLIRSSHSQEMAEWISYENVAGIRKIETISCRYEIEAIEQTVSSERNEYWPWKVWSSNWMNGTDLTMIERRKGREGMKEEGGKEGSMNREVKKWLCQELWEGDIGDRIDLKEEKERRRRRCRIRMRLSEELLADKQTYGHIDNCLWIEQWRNREGKEAIKSSTSRELKSNQTQTYRFTL